MKEVILKTSCLLTEETFHDLYDLYDINLNKPIVLQLTAVNGEDFKLVINVEVNYK